MPKDNSKLYFSRDCSITISLKRLQSSFDGTDQLCSAIGRVIANWDDVWDPTGVQFRVSSSRSFSDFEAEDAEREAADRLRSSNATKIKTAKLLLAAASN
jgi:hypothetical protein